MSSDEDALTGRLTVVTLSTVDLDAVQAFYVDALGMEMQGPHELDPESRRQQKELWGIDEAIEYDVYTLVRPTIPENMVIRVLHLATETPMIHSSYHSRELGPFSIGFPNAAQESLERTDQRERLLFYGTHAGRDDP